MSLFGEFRRRDAFKVDAAYAAMAYIGGLLVFPAVFVLFYAIRFNTAGHEINQLIPGWFVLSVI